MATAGQVLGAGPLADRADAGRRLAGALERYRSMSPVVLAIPRGGIPVGYEISRTLGCPLDVLLVRKVGAPGDPEYGLGAVAEGGIVRVDARRAREAGAGPSDLEPVVRREVAELAARAARYRGDRAPVPVEGRTAIVVDDGVATGGTVEAGVEVVRARRARSVVVALGVAPLAALTRLRAIADDVVVVLAPAYFEAVGQWYVRFEPVGDDEVVRLLQAARHGVPPTAG